jgi:MFS family permease
MELVEPSRESWIARFSSRYLFYGWVIVAGGFLAQMITSISMQGFSTYVEPLRVDFGWSAGQTAAGRSFQQVDTFLGPVSGWLADRFGARRLMTAGVLLYVIAFTLFSQIDSLWGFYAACLIMALANSLVGLVTVSIAINHWFRRRRSTAMGLAVMGLAAAGVVFIPLLVWAQSTLGWRAAALGSAGAVLIIGLPIMLLMRDAPEPFGLRPDNDLAEPGNGSDAGRGGGLIHFSLSQALGTRAFWFVNGAMALAMAVQSAVIVHQFPQLESIVDRETAALVVAELNVFNIAGRMFGGILGDRFAKHMVLGVNLFVTALALLTLALGSALPALLVYGALFGFSWGTRTAVFNSLLGDYFGRTAFGKIAGLSATLASPLAVISPVLVGFGVDWLHSYLVPLLALSATALVSSAFFFLARRPGAPSQ